MKNMNANSVIEAYIDDTVRLLPRDQRTDVADELRALLNEELQARARARLSPPDTALALSIVRDYGRPNEAAARYHTPWTIIDPADTTSFVRAAVVGAAALLLLAGVATRLPPGGTSGEGFFKVGIFAWLGVLVSIFAVRSLLHRRSPKQWKPKDRDRVSRVGTAVLIPVVSPILVLYAAPVWVLRTVSGGRLDPTGATYTREFQLARLPIFIGLLASLLALQACVAFMGRWTRLTRRVGIGINMALACMLLFFSVDGGIFASEQSDRLLREILALVGVIYLPAACALLYGEIGRIERRRDPVAAG